MRIYCCFFFWCFRVNELNSALKAAELAGEILRKHFFSAPSVRSKGYRDIVTDADVDSENALKKFFAENFPSYGFVGEETEKNFVEGGRNWIVDPLDGTREFSFGIPHFSVSIALFEGKKVLLGVVYNPILNDFYHAELGKGAFKNNKRISCGQKSVLRESLSSGCFAYSRPELAKFAYANKILLINYSPALDLCGVASGRIDSVVYTFCNFADCSAGALIATEAGAVVTNFGKTTFSPFDNGIMASNPVLYQQICRLFPKPLEEITFEEAQYKQSPF